VRAVPTSIEGNWRLAEAARARARPADAEPHLRAVLDAEPDHLDARLALAAVLRARGDVLGAVVQSRQAFDRSGQHPEIGEALVWMLCEHGDRQAALDVLALLDDDEATPATLLRLAWIRLTLGELTAAARVAAVAEHKARAARDDASRALVAEAVVARASALRARGEAAAAIEALRPLAPTDADAAALLSSLHLAAGDVDEALAAATGVTAAANHAELALARALARHARGDGTTSGAALHAAATQRPTDRALALAWARFLDETGAPDAAITWLTQAAPRWPSASSVQNQLGYLLVQRGRPDDLARALPLLARARALAPGDPTVLDSWGLLRLRQGELTLAARALGRAADLAPREPEILLHLAELNAARGELARARHVARRALALPCPPALRARLEALLATWTAASPG
jgi:Flp pilus assembly protein TadD